DTHAGIEQQAHQRFGPLRQTPIERASFDVTQIRPSPDRQYEQITHFWTGLAIPFVLCLRHRRHRGIVRDHSAIDEAIVAGEVGDRKSTRLNSSHRTISYAVFCLKKKKKKKKHTIRTK